MLPAPSSDHPSKECADVRRGSKTQFDDFRATSAVPRILLQKSFASPLLIVISDLHMGSGSIDDFEPEIENHLETLI
jgi:hypothetical protein